MRPVSPHILLLVLAGYSFACATPDTDTKTDDTDTTTETDAESDDTDAETDDETSFTLTDVRAGFGPVGATVKLIGTGFDVATSLVVKLGSTPVTVSSVKATSLEVIVPELLPGTYAFKATSDQGATDAVDFEVRLPPMVYVMDDNNARDSIGNLSYYTIDEAHALTAHPSSPIATDLSANFGFGGVPGSMAIDVAHRRLYATGRKGLAFYSIDGATGALTAHQDSPLVTGAGENFGVAIDASGQNLYVSRCRDEDIAHFLVATDGSLTPAPTPTYALAACTDQVVLTADGSRLYSGDGDQFFGFDVGSGGALTPFDDNPMAFTLGTSYGWALHPTRSRLYAASYAKNLVAAYDIDATTGVISELVGGPFDVAGDDPQPNGMVFSADGAYAFVALWGASQLARFDVAADGTLTRQQTVETVNQPAPMALSVDGTMLVVLGQGNHTIETFDVAADGALSATGSTVDVGENTYPQAVILTGL